MAGPGVDANCSHDCIAQRTATRSVVVDVEPDAGGDAADATPGADVAVGERGAEAGSLVAWQAQLRNASWLELAVGRGARATSVASGRRAEAMQDASR